VVSAQVTSDRYPFVKDSKVGFIDASGREVIPPRFSNAGDTSHFQNGLAPVFEAGKGSGYIDPLGAFVIGPTEEWGWGRPFHEGIASVLIWGKNGARNTPGFIDHTGKIIFSGGSEGSYFSDGLMPMPRDGKWGFVDRSFKFVIEPQFDWAEPFSESRAVVQLGRKWGYIDTKGKIVIPIKYDLVWHFQDGLGRIRIDIPKGTFRTMEGPQTRYIYQYGFVDAQGNEVIPMQFDEATFFSGGYGLASDPGSKLLGVIDKQGTFVHIPAFESGSEFHEGLAAVCVNDACGYVDTAGRWIIPAAFSNAGDFRGGLARVSWPDKAYGYIDKSGKTIWKNSPAKSEASK
jgi:hypothetical protein